MADIQSIADLKPDPKNARTHGPRNVGMIVDSLHEVGAARSIVIDEAGNILAGNGTIEAAAEAGIERVQVVDADGETIVAVRRSGLTPAQKKRLALLDNRTAELAEWDAAVLAGLAQEGVEIGDLWSDDELTALLMHPPTGEDWMAAFEQGDNAPSDKVQITFVLTPDQAAIVRKAVERLGGDKDTALVAMAEQCLKS